MNETNAFYESEKCFRRYENYIIQALIAYPEEVRFEPQGKRAANTDATRCRDAITSWRKNKWPSDLDPLAYKTKLADLTAWTNMGFICVGSRRVLRILRTSQSEDKQKAKLGLFIKSMTAPKKSSTVDEDYLAQVMQETVEDFSKQPIEKAVMMIDEGLHAGPYFCENTDENLERVKLAIGDRLNVVFVINSEGKIQII